MLTLRLTLAFILLEESSAWWWFDQENELEVASVKKLEKFWIDPSDIASNLDEYSALWIKPHGCVWSECAVDDTDDGYKGDNRDGDEHWYQYRTQEFCANAGFSLYGVKKDDHWTKQGVGLLGCTRYTFINSFFTYGGADNLLLALGQEPIVYYGDNNENGDDDAYRTSNAQCVALNEEEEGSGEYNAYATTMGCAVDGSYVIASFESENCDGNYFQDIVDPFESYNDQHSSIGCHRIWDKDTEDDTSISYIFNNAWTCDYDLYPDGCPDPYGKKERYDWALRTISHGGNPELAYKNMLWKQPLRITSIILAVLMTAMAK